MSENAINNLASPMPPNPSTFSYAQAAKGRSVPQNGTAGTSSPSIGSTSDKADVESGAMQTLASNDTEPKTPVNSTEHSNGIVVGGGDQKEEAALKRMAIEVASSVENGTPHDQNANASLEQSHDTLSSSGSASQVAQPLKEDDVFATQNESDSTWDQVSQESQAGVSNEKFEPDIDDSRLSTWEHVQGPQLKEAPVPSINVWQKRAQDAKAKVKETKPTSPSVSRDPKLENSTESLKENSKRKAENGSVMGKETLTKSQVPAGESTRSSPLKICALTTLEANPLRKVLGRQRVRKASELRLHHRRHQMMLCPGPRQTLQRRKRRRNLKTKGKRLRKRKLRAGLMVRKSGRKLTTFPLQSSILLYLLHAEVVA